MAPRGAKIIYEVSLKPDRSAALAAQSMPALYGRARGLPDGRNAVGFLSTKRPWQNLVLPRPLFPCPICAQRRPRITKSSGSCSRARLGTCQNAPRGFLPSHGLPPTMAAFRRKATQLQIQLRGKPRIPTGFLLIPPPRSAAAKGMMIRRISFTMSKIPQHRTIVNCFLCILAASYNCPPNNSLQSNRVRQHFSVVKPARSEYNKK